VQRLNSRSLAHWRLLLIALKWIHCHTLMSKQNEVVFLILRSSLHSMLSCTAPLLLNMSGEPETLCAATGVSAFVAAILKLRLLGVVSAVHEFTACEERLTHCTF
jgi:hypothetical protein